eukprot:1361489-Rhodomonas_salina.1
MAMVLCMRYAVSCTDLAYAAMRALRGVLVCKLCAGLRELSACGTEIGYAATRRSGSFSLHARSSLAGAAPSLDPRP